MPDRPPRALFVDAGAYRQWVAAVRFWQQYVFVQHGLRKLPSNEEELRRSLHAIARGQKSAPVARWLRIWLPCTGTPGGSAPERKRLLLESVATDDSPRHILQLSVLAAERFGGAEDVVERLNQLLQRFPDDQFGLARWRRWMVQLAERALEEGRFKQALLQYVSLILYLPDERTGWVGCAKVLELIGEGKRAADCWRQALRVGKRADRRWNGGESADARAALATAENDKSRVELDMLRNLLAEPGLVPTAHFPFTGDVLKRAIVQSLHAPDVYVRFLLERWSEGPSSRVNSG